MHIQYQYQNLKLCILATIVVLSSPEFRKPVFFCNGALYETSCLPFKSSHSSWLSLEHLKWHRHKWSHFILFKPLDTYNGPLYCIVPHRNNGPFYFDWNALNTRHFPEMHCILSKKKNKIVLMLVIVFLHNDAKK